MATKQIKLRIFQNLQRTHDDLKIGAGNFLSGKFISEKNVEKEGVTAGLWFFFRDRPQLDQSVRVYKGEKFTIGGYKFSITDIVQAGKTAYVDIQFIKLT